MLFKNLRKLGKEYLIQLENEAQVYRAKELVNKTTTFLDKMKDAFKKESPDNKDDVTE